MIFCWRGRWLGWKLVACWSMTDNPFSRAANHAGTSHIPLCSNFNRHIFITPITSNHIILTYPLHSDRKYHNCHVQIYLKLNVNGLIGPQLLVGGPLGLLDFVLRALRVTHTTLYYIVRNLTKKSPRNTTKITEKSQTNQIFFSEICFLKFVLNFFQNIFTKKKNLVLEFLVKISFRFFKLVCDFFGEFYFF